jgi:hypothetical protein
VSQEPPPPPPGGPYYGGTPPGQWGPPGPWEPGRQLPPRPPGGIPVWAQVLSGTAIGLFAGIALLILVVIVVASAQDGNEDLSGATFFWIAVLVPVLFPVPMLFFRPTRMWGVGLMIGVAVSTISLAGACAAIITGLEGSA